MSIDIQHGTYTGGIDHLNGATALLMPAKDGVLKAQFDDTSLAHGSVSLGYGWHEFPASDFTIDNP